MCQTNSKAVASMLALKSFKDDARRNWKGRLFDNMAFVLKRKLHLKLSAITFLGEIWMVPFWSLWGFFLGVLLRGDKTSGQDPHNRGTLVYWFAWQFVMLRQKHSNATGAARRRSQGFVTRPFLIAWRAKIPLIYLLRWQIFDTARVFAQRRTPGWRTLKFHVACIRILNGIQFAQFPSPNH